MNIPTYIIAWVTMHAPLLGFTEESHPMDVASFLKDQMGLDASLTREDHVLLDGWVKELETIEFDATILLIKEWFMQNHEQQVTMNWGFPIQVCKSAAGYYIGQLDLEGYPYARLSVEYYATADEARDAVIWMTFSAKTWL